MIVDTKKVYDEKKAAGASPDSLLELWYPRRDSNPCFRLRRPTLYPAELRGHLDDDVEYSPFRTTSYLEQNLFNRGFTVFFQVEDRHGPLPF